MTSKILLQLILVSCLLIFVGCTKEDNKPTENYDQILLDLSNNVILANYKELNIKANDLVTSIDQLQSNKDDNNLTLSREAWRAARVPWEQSEGFLFGPVDQQGIDPSLDSWPVNKTDLEQVLNSGNTLTSSYINGLEGTLKGFHTIEYLLFGEDGKKKAADFTSREFEYLTSCAQSLASSTQQLYYAWKPDQQNFINKIITAGQPSNTVYPSQKAALQEIITGLITIADEVANGKINDPFVQGNVALEESRFSANSKADFADNIRSIQNVYLGSYLSNKGQGLTDIINSKNESLDNTVKNKITMAIHDIENIPGTFTDAIFNDKNAVLKAQLSVRTLQQTLESDVLNLILNL